MSPKMALTQQINDAVTIFRRDEVEDRGRGYASDAEAWAEIKISFEKAKKLAADLDKVQKEIWEAVRDDEEDAFGPLVQAFARSALFAAAEWAEAAGKAMIAVED